MPAQKLSYKVDVDTGEAVRDLDRLGKAGGDAGKDIADGFDKAASTSQQAIAKMVAGLDDAADEAKRTMQAVETIGRAFGDGFDAQATAGLVQGLRKAGAEFDDIEAEADQLVATLKKIDGVRLDAATTGVKHVGDELEDTGRKAKVSSETFQSGIGPLRGLTDEFGAGSTAAGTWGNALIDAGEAGQIFGSSLGLNEQQLEKMSTALGVAGVGFAGALVAWQALSASFKETHAFDKKQAEEFAAAIADVGDSYAAILQLAQSDSGLQARVQGGGLLNEIFPRDETVDLVKQLDAVGLSIADVQEVIRSGVRFQDFPDWLNGSSDAAVRFRAKLDELRAAGVDTDSLMSTLRTVTGAYSDANVTAGQKARVFASSLETINEALSNQRISADPMSVLADRFFTLGGQVYDLQALWDTLVSDLRDGQADFAGSAEYADVLGEAMHMTGDEVAILAAAQGDYQKAAGDSAGATDIFTESQTNAADAVQGQVDALADLIDRQHEQIDASHDAAGAWQDWDDAFKDFVSGADDVSEALDEHARDSPEWIDAMRGQRDEVTGLVESYVTMNTEIAKSNGHQQTALEVEQDRAEALGMLAGTVDDDVIPSLAIYYQQLLKIPASKRSEFAMVLASGDQAEIEAFIAANSGTFTAAVEVTANEAQLAKTSAQIDSVAIPRTAPVTAQAHTGNAKTQLLGLAAPITTPVKADPSQAATTMAQFRTNQQNTPISVPVRTYDAGGYRAGGSYGPQPSPDAATATATAAAAPTSAPSAFTMPAVTVPAPSITVNLSAGVVGNRWDLQRWVRSAIRNQERLGRPVTATVAAS